MARDREVARAVKLTWHEQNQMCRANYRQYKSFLKINFFRLFFGLVSADGEKLFAVVHLPQARLWQWFGRPPPRSCWSCPRQQEASKLQLRLWEQKKVCWCDRAGGGPSGRLSLPETSAHRHQNGLLCCPSIIISPETPIWPFWLEKHWEVRALLILATSTVSLPDFLDSGSESNQNVSGPFRHFGYFFLSLVVTTAFISCWHFLALDCHLSSDRMG